MKNYLLKVENLKVSVEDSNILNGVNLTIDDNSVCALMGPNGSGKSTLAQVIMGHSGYEITSGNILLEGKSLLKMSPDKRAGLGIFLSFQYPSEIPGVSIPSYLRMIYNKRFDTSISPVKFRKILQEKMKLLDMKDSILERYLNEGFSGGEKKKMEILQMLVLEPKLVILDETDSGLDIDAIKVVSKAVNYLLKEKNATVLLITHYSRILKYIEPNKVYILREGRIVQEGGRGVVHELEEKGYSPFGD